MHSLSPSTRARTWLSKLISYRLSLKLLSHQCNRHFCKEQYLVPSNSLSVYSIALYIVICSLIALMCVPERAAVCIRQFTYMQYFTVTSVNTHSTYIWYCKNSCANSYTNSTNIMQTPENSSNTFKNYILANYKCLVMHCSGLWTGLCTKYYLHFFVYVNTHTHEPPLMLSFCWL